MNGKGKWVHHKPIYNSLNPTRLPSLHFTLTFQFSRRAVFFFFISLSTTHHSLSFLFAANWVITHERVDSDLARRWFAVSSKRSLSPQGVSGLFSEISTRTQVFLRYSYLPICSRFLISHCFLSCFNGALGFGSLFLDFNSMSMATISFMIGKLCDV